MRTLDAEGIGETDLPTGQVVFPSHSRLHRAALLPDGICLMFALVVRRDRGVMRVHGPRSRTGCCDPLAHIVQHAHLSDDGPRVCNIQQYLAPLRNASSENSTQPHTAERPRKSAGRY